MTRTPSPLASLSLSKPVSAAWRAVALPSWGEPCSLTVVRYSDGTGQAFTESGFPLYVEGVAFEDEPSGHLDPAFVAVTQLV